jgi:RNA polymerase subunit RPABC4/transcription elongation factor Spt4
MVSYSCGRCGADVRSDDKACPNCAADLSQVGRKIAVIIEERVSISDDIFAQVTPQERVLLRRLYEWLRTNWTLSQIEVGFPSGVKFIFKRQEQPTLK